MKVIERITWDIETGEVIEEVAHYSDQKPAMCDFSPDVNVPGTPPKTDTELELEKEQLAALRESNLYSKLITPVTLGQAGYKIVTDPDGTQRLEMMTAEEKLASMSTTDRALYEASLRSMGLSSTGQRLSEDELLSSMTDSERRSYELQRAYEERQQQALSGNLPVSPALEKELASQKEALVNTLSAKLGPNWQLSTPGMKAMSDFETKSELLREEARRGQISTGEALITAQAQKNQTDLTEPMNVGNYLNTLSGSTGNKLYSVPAAYQSMVGTYGNVLAPYQTERMKIYDNNVSAAMQSSANKAALYGSLISGVSRGVGAYYGAR